MASPFSPFALKGDGTPFKSPSRRAQGLDRADLEQLKRHAAYSIERARDGPASEKTAVPARTAGVALDRESMQRVVKANDKWGEFVHTLANEPSIGLHHVCNHVRRSVPSYVSWKNALETTTKKVDALGYDLDMTVDTMHDLGRLENFKTLKDLILSCTKETETIISMQKKYAHDTLLLPHIGSNRSKSSTSSPFTSPFSSTKTISRLSESDFSQNEATATSPRFAQDDPTLPPADAQGHSGSLADGFLFKTF